MDEWIDVVDEKDRVIRKVRRSQAHRKHLRHRRSAVLIFGDSKYHYTLLQKRSKSKDVAPGKWAHLEGHLASGENYMQGAKREIEEEMFRGQKISGIKLQKLFKIKCSLDNDEVFITVFRTLIKGPFKLQKEEVATYKFVLLKDLLKDIKLHPKKYTETSRLLFKEYVRERK